MLVRDLVYALRAMRRNPMFFVTAVFTVALGIGANTTIFTVVHAVLLKPLAYREPERLVEISGGATPLRFEQIKKTSHSFVDVGAYGMEENVTFAGSEPEVLKAARISADFLRILDVYPLLGRSFAAEEDTPGGPAAVMITPRLWHQKFGSDPHVIGRPIVLDAASYPVVGILPERFEFPFPGLDVLFTQPSESPSVAPKSRQLSPTLTVFGRLKPGVSIQQARAEMRVVQHQYAAAHPAMLDAKPKSPAGVVPLKDQLVGHMRSVLWMLFGAVTFVLLIACANVASLLLARAGARSREFGIRAALGAARSRLIGQLLAESVLLSVAGGVVGLVLAVASLHVARDVTSLNLPRASEIHLDWTVLGFTTGLTLITGILFGLWPSFRASRPDVIGVLRARSEALNQDSSGSIRSGTIGRRILVIGQVALSIVLLIGAALLTESVARLRADNPGFNPANLLTMRVSLPVLRYSKDTQKSTFFDELIRRVKPLPGVRGAAAAMTLPMTGFAGTPVQDASKPLVPLNQRLIATILIVTPGYFHALEIAMRRGRDFSERDKQGTQRVAIIDENLARRFWPAFPAGPDPVGQFIFIGGVNPQPAQIVGIAANVHQNIENSAWPESVYEVYAQNPLSSALLAVRAEGDPMRLSTAIRKQVKSLDRNQPISDVRTMQELVDAELGERRVLMTLLLSFAAAALILAVIGLYGVISYSVTQRTFELGVRRALGAQESEIVWLIAGEGLQLAAFGALFGVAAALALTRVMKTMLFHVSTTDPTTFLGVALLFVLVALAASYVPARRATRIDPLQALRYE